MLLASSALAILMVSPAAAQDVVETGEEAVDEASNLPGDIVVTARRREESLLDVPIAISAFTAESIEARGVKDIRTLAEFTPGLFAETDFAISTGRDDRSSTRLTFRGLSVAGGGTFINGVPYAGSGTPDVTDAARVEILKGPQAVYFGRSTYSGAVNYVTKDPSSDLSGLAEFEIGSFGRMDGRIAIEGPIAGDALTARASVRRYHSGGQYKNGGSSGGRLGEEDSLTATFAFTARPTSALTLRGFYSYNHDEDGPPPTASIKNAGSGLILNCDLGGNTGSRYWCGELPSVSDLPASYISIRTTMDTNTTNEVVNNIRGRTDLLFDPAYLDHFGFKQDVHHTSLRADYETESGFNIAAIAAYSQTKQQRLNTFTGRDVSEISNPNFTGAPGQFPYYTFVSMQQSKYEEKFFEARVSTPQDQWIRATAGASYFELNRPGEVGLSVSPLGRGNNANAKSGIFTPAVFGGVYISPIEALTLTLEGRYQWDKIKSEQVFPIPANPAATNFDRTWKNFSPRVSLDYKPTPETMLYATFARGYRQGGFNATFAALSDANKAIIRAQSPDASEFYDQERLDNYEVGFKAAFFDRRLRTTVSLYKMDWIDGQVTNNVFFGGTAAVITLNRGTVELKGIEAEAAFAISRDFLLEGTLQYADNKIVDYVYLDGLKINNSSDVEGNQLDQSPQWAWTVSPSYNTSLGGAWDGFARVDYRHRGKIFVDPTNVAFLGARDLFNVRFGFTNKDEGFRAEFFVNNLLDDDKISAAQRGNDVVYRSDGTSYVAGVALNLNELRIGLPEKREFGLRLTKSF